MQRGRGHAVSQPLGVPALQRAGWKPTELLQRFSGFVLLRCFPSCGEEADIVKAGKVYWLANRVVFLCTLLICVGAFQNTAGWIVTVTVSVASHYGDSDNISCDEGNGKHDAEKK